MLGEMELRDGGDASKARSHDVIELPPKLCDLGITKMQSHRWQLSASVPSAGSGRCWGSKNYMPVGDHKTTLTMRGVFLKK
jgi:hypothetical protein